jgi:hypothetical protein
MIVPTLLLRAIDPAQVYLDRHRLDPGAGHRPTHRQAAVFGPDIAGGSRPATDVELAELAEHAAGHYGDHEAQLADAKRRWTPDLERAAGELLATGATRIALGDRTVDARVLRFWRGDDLLHTTTRTPNGGGESLSRLSRDSWRRSTDVLAEYLARAITKG